MEGEAKKDTPCQKKTERAEEKMKRKTETERGVQRMNEDGESEGKMRGCRIFLHLNLHKTFITTNLGREP